MPHQHFKMGGFHWLKFILQNGDYMYKIDLKESQKKEVCTSSFASALDQTQHQELYQVMKGSNVSAKVFDDSGNNIPGRSINFREYYGRDTCNTALCNISAAAPRICDKFQKLCFRTNSESRVSGYDCELKDNDIVFTSGKGSENKESVSGCVQCTRDNLVRTNTFVRNINFYYSSYSPSASSITTNTNTKKECILHGHSDIERYDQRGTCMVDKKLRINQWLGHYSVSLTDTNTDRCFQERLGCSVSRDKNWGACGQRRNRSITQIF